MLSRQRKMKVGMVISWKTMLYMAKQRPKNFQLAEFDAQNFPDRVRKSFLWHRSENAWSFNSANCFYVYFHVDLGILMQKPQAMLIKNFPYYPNNFQSVKQIPKIFQVIQKFSKLSRDFHTDQKIQTVRRLSNRVRKALSARQQCWPESFLRIWKVFTTCSLLAEKFPDNLENVRMLQKVSR